VKCVISAPMAAPNRNTEEGIHSRKFACAFCFSTWFTKGIMQIR